MLSFKLKKNNNQHLQKQHPCIHCISSQGYTVQWLNLKYLNNRQIAWLLTSLPSFFWEIIQQLQFGPSMTSWVNLCPFIESIHPDHKRVWIDSILRGWTNSKCHWRSTLYVMAAMLWQLCCGGYAVSALLWRLCCGSYALVMAAMIGNKSYFCPLSRCGQHKLSYITEYKNID